jgi:hypothetical protein
MTDPQEPVDLGMCVYTAEHTEALDTVRAVGLPTAADPTIPAGEIWAGPVGADAMRAFGPGTTAGGRAEAGWFLLGHVADDGPTFVADQDAEQ